jgi:uncharacterized protein YjbI with pentapeptide repeats
VKDPVYPADQLAPSSDPASPEFAIGDLHLPRDVYYAAGDIKAMLDRKALFYEVRGEPGELPESDRGLPGLDLAYVHLYGVNWKGIDVAWLRGGKYFPSVDLRRAELSDSKWSGSTLKGAYLRCAVLEHAKFNPSDLRDADLRRAKLMHADLRNSDLRGAKLDGANLTDVKLDGALVEEADFAGAKIDPEALKKAKDGDKAKGVGEPSQIPPSERLECEAP